MTIYFFPPLGKESVILMGIGLNYHPLVVVTVIVFCDIMVALFLMYNYDLLKLIPVLGKWVDKVETKGADITSNKPWLRKFRFIGVTLFVMFPLQGSGGVGATIAGRLIGMNKYITFLAICIGSIVGCTIITYTGELLKNILYENMVLGIAIIIILLIAGIMFYRRNKNRATI